MLENKIEELTSAIYMMNNTLKAFDETLRALIGEAVKEAVETVKVTEEAPVEKPVEKTADDSAVSFEEVQGIIMKIMRDDRSKKAEITALLGEYGASLLKEVPTDKLGEVREKLKAMS